LLTLAGRALAVLPGQIDWAARSLSATDDSWPSQPCLCDPWHDHYLFEADLLTGLIDYGATQSDHPAVDLARTLGSLVENDEPSWQTGLAAYRAVRPFSQGDEALGRLLDRTGVALSLARWLIRLYHAREPVADRLSLAQRLERLIVRLEAPSPGKRSV
jgi:Ser/Thr protein kinase RdoA (MazF antagonist)